MGEIQLPRTTPSDLDNPPAGLDALFLADGTETTTSGALYAKDSTGTVRAVGGGGGEDASGVAVTPFGSIAATNVQAALEEIVAESGGGGGGSYDDEQAQDAVGTILLDSTSIDFTYNDATPSITAVVKSDAITNAMMADGSVGTAELIADAVTNSKLGNMAQNTIKGRVTASTGDPEDLTAAQTKTLLALVAGDIAVTPFSTIAATNVQAALQEIVAESGGGGGGYGDEQAQDAIGTILVDTATIDLTYDDATPSITAAVIDHSVTNSKLANVATGTIKGRTTAGTGDPEDLTGAQARAVLALSFFATLANLSGDVTTSGGATATVANNAVTNAKMADVATATIKGRATAGTGDPEDLTAAQTRTLLGLVIGTNVQAWDADLDTWATKTAPSGTAVGTTDTQTLTNKRLTERPSSPSFSATPTINTDNLDCVELAGLSGAITSMTTNLTGTPTNFQNLVIRYKDDGTARAITHGASFAAGSVALPTTTILGKWKTVVYQYFTSSSKWCSMSVLDEV